MEHLKEDYINYRFGRSKETLAEIEELIRHQFWNTAVNRMYYACFYAVSALLYKNDIDVQSQNGCRLKFGQHFVHSGKISKELGKHFSELFLKRQTGDYDDFIDFDKELVLELYKPTVEFINEIKKLLDE